MIVSTTITNGHYRRCRATMTIRPLSSASADRGLWRRSAGSSTRASRTELRSPRSLVEHDLNTNQLFTWRRQLGAGLATPQELASILPVTITPDATAEYSAPGLTGQMEIVLAEGDRITVWADVETAALSRVVKALRR